MRILTVFAFVSTLVPFTVYGQKPIIRSATEQQWSGGIAGRWGVRYTFSIQFTDIKETPIPDTIWIGNDAIPLTTITHPGMQHNTVVTNNKKGHIWTITVGTSHDDRRTPGDDAPERLCPIYRGVALLRYTYRGSHSSLAVKKITTHYPSLSYP
jgi:hypothetical protein